MQPLSARTLSTTEIKSFQEFVWDFYYTQGRKFAWRNNENPYHIFISEIMLQQTQTHRVEKKFVEFTDALPTFKDLADASMRELLAVWSGLGYNRRALYTQKSAQKVINEFGGILPDDPEILVTFPGIGKATAASICAFAFNKPTIFIETNIRAVFIHSFFRDRTEVHDKEIEPLVAATVDHINSREWYYALMDYGVFLKKNIPNPNRKSAHHSVQSRFEGSDRQIRGAILRLLTAHQSLTLEHIIVHLAKEPARVTSIISRLCKEGFLIESNSQFSLLQQ